MVLSKKLQQNPSLKEFVKRTLRIKTHDSSHDTLHDEADKKSQDVGNKIMNAAANEEKEFECDYPGCTKSFQTKNGLIAHKKWHARWDKEFKCDLCPRSFKTEQGLKLHVAKTHEGGNLKENLKGRGNTMCIRVNDGDYLVVEALVEIGMFKSFSEASAFLIHNAIMSNSDYYKKILDISKNLKNIKAEAISLLLKPNRDDYEDWMDESTR